MELEAAISRIVEVIDERDVKATLYHKTPETDYFLIHRGKDTPTIEKVPRKVAKRGHSFRTLEGLQAYLLGGDHAGDEEANTATQAAAPKSEVAKNPGPVFVEDDYIRATFDYHTHDEDSVTLPLSRSNEFISLRHLATGVDQKTLWRKLVTDLSESFPAGLLIMIQNIDLVVNAKSQVEINAVGLETKNASRTLQIKVRDPEKGGEKTEKVSIDWVWSGSIFECFDYPVQIATTLELSEGENGLKFTFHPKKMDAIVRETQLALVDKVRELLPDHLVLEGTK